MSSMDAEVLVVAEKITQPSSHFMRDFISGTLAGMSITIVGHPFDTIKVRLQTQVDNSKFRGMSDCIRQTYAKEGLRGYYKGMGSPFSTVPIVNAVVFSAYGQAKRWIGKFDDNELTIPQLIGAGAWAGFVNSFVVGPVELIKARLQIQYDSPAHSQFKGPVDCLRKTIQTQGIKGVFRGMSATIYREVPAYAAQFGTYESCKRAIASFQGIPVTDLAPAALLLSGGIGGIGCWVFSYPQDLVKTRLQVQPDGQASKYKPSRLLLDGGFFSCWKEVVRTDGYRGLWRGFTPCVARAFPANAAGFLTYELAQKAFAASNF
eukprot:GILK01008615.1.p1 GENE.GILK01008615.1~~GILK01008615.1.p1  ORF type:complete len:330 (+),score=32.19 GILK01008615.1:36-992(+)